MALIINNDTATPVLSDLYAKIAPGRRRPLMRVLGKGLEIDLRAHFRARDSDGNRRGWPRSHFWGRRIRTATAFSGATDATATVTISDPAFAARLNGAVIRPVTAKALSIPVSPEAAAAGMPSARVIPGVFLMRTRLRGAWLARREGKALRLLWKLVPQVKVPKDPKALPPQSVLGSNAERRAGEFILKEAAQ